MLKIVIEFRMTRVEVIKSGMNQKIWIDLY